MNMNINVAIENVQKMEHMGKFIHSVAFLLLTLLLVVVGLIWVDDINVPSLSLSTSSSTTTSTSAIFVLFQRRELNLCGRGNGAGDGSHPEDGSIDTPKVSTFPPNDSL